MYIFFFSEKHVPLGMVSDIDHLGRSKGQGL